MRQSKTKRLRRDDILDYICAYAQEHNGNSPSMRAIARALGIAYPTARVHVLELVAEGKLRIEDNQLIVEQAEWTPPPYLWEKISN